MGMEASSKRRPFFSLSEELYDDEYFDKQMQEKKRRLTAEQVHVWSGVQNMLFDPAHYLSIPLTSAYCFIDPGHIQRMELSSHNLISMEFPPQGFLKDSILLYCSRLMLFMDLRDP